MEAFHDDMNDFKPDLVILAGLHMLEREDSNYVDTRLDQVNNNHKLYFLSFLIIYPSYVRERR
jgi:hypothetical protein